MADRIYVVPENLRRAAGHHEETSEYLRSLPLSHQAIQDSLDSLGPIFAELREAGRELLEQRRMCYEQQADSHAKMAENLTKSASMFEEQEAQSVQRLKSISDDSQ